jgi:hypothetical protein
MKPIVVLLAGLLGADVVLPVGTHLPIRFLQRITSGRDTVGTALLVQTMAAVVQDSCIVVPPYMRVKGHVVVSTGGGRFGRHGKLGIVFDSLEVRPGRWAGISGVLDTLEYAKPGTVAASGVVTSGKTTLVGVGTKLVPAGVAAAADVRAIPVALLGGYALFRRGPPVRILAGEIGGVRLTEPLTVAGETCDSGARPCRRSCPARRTARGRRWATPSTSCSWGVARRSTALSGLPAGCAHRSLPYSRSRGR